MSGIILRLTITSKEAHRLKEAVEKGERLTAARDQENVSALADDGSLESRIEKEAQLRKIEEMEREAEALKAIDIDILAYLLDSHHSKPVIQGSRFVSFTAYKKVRSLCPPEIAFHLTAELFLELRYAEMDSHGRVKNDEIIRYLLKKMNIRRNMVSLLKISFKRFLDPEDVNTMLDCLYIRRIKHAFEEYPEMRDEVKVQPLHYSWFCESRLWFVLDPLRQGKVRAMDLAISGMMEEMRSQVEAIEFGDLNQLESTQHTMLSILKCEVVTSRFNQLDTDANGYLSVEELLKYNGGEFSPLFIRRVFAISRTYNDNELDFIGFLDFIQAVEDRSRECSQRWLFRALDLADDGVLTRPEILAHFGSMLKVVEGANFCIDLYDKEGAADSVFDMAKPAQPGRITIRDVLACKMGHTLLFTMIDVGLFMELFENTDERLSAAGG